MADLSVSIVTYAPNLRALDGTLQSLTTAVGRARQAGVLDSCRLFLVDNGPGAAWAALLGERLGRLAGLPGVHECRLLTGQGNVGYGQGHNLAAAQAQAAYHLVLNPDVTLAPEAIVQAFAFLERHPEAGMLAPAAEDPSGSQLFLCKRYPTVLDLALRAWAPGWLRNRFRKRLARYELRDQYGQGDESFAVLIASGCFMFCRRAAWDAAGGFSPRYFLYFEDFDLSLRLGRHARIVYVPAVRILHAGGGASRKGWRHLVMFAQSAWVFFNTHGWKFL